jgi:hypothetical protein
MTDPDVMADYNKATKDVRAYLERRFPAVDSALQKGSAESGPQVIVIPGDPGCAKSACIRDPF